MSDNPVMDETGDYALVAFLNARIDEDEESARSARVLRDVAFKRALVARLAVPDPHQPGEPCPECLTLRQLAAVYAGHPDYRQEWAP